MRFSKTIQFALLIVFFSCSNEQENPVIQEPYMGVDEVREFINEINFTGQISTGQKVDFVPSNILNSSSGTNYTNPDQLNFTNDQSLLFNVETFSERGGLLKVFSYSTGDSFDVNFDYVLILTFEELERLFPNEVNIDVEMKQWVLGIGFGSDEFDVEDLIDSGLDEVYGVTDFIQVIIDPSDALSLVGLWITEGEDSVPLYLTGEYQYTESNIKSNGLVEYNYFSGSAIIGSYDLTLQE